MDSSPPSRLDPFQRELLQAFFDRERRFFLTGGAALAGYYLGHRETRDLDLFTTEEAMDDGVAALRDAAHALGASMESLRTAPDFHRFLLSRGEETVVVDLVLERVPQSREKMHFGTVAVDPPEEILANKLCTLLSRAELRDLVDARALERAGYPMEASLDAAASKDAGLTPGQLAWVLSEISIGDDAEPPGVTARDLRNYLDDLVERLTRLSFPAG